MRKFRTHGERLAAGLAVAAIGTAANQWWRARIRERFDKAHARRFQLGPNGLVVGAEGFTLSADGRGAVLLLHGFNDTPQSMAYLAGYLNAHGYTVRAPLLPGHGVSLSAMARESRADAWRDVARAEYDVLRETHASVSIIGQSMGGALAVRLATERHTVESLVLLAPYLGMPRNLQFKIAVAWVAQAMVPYRTSIGGETSIHDPEARAMSLGPGVVTARTLTELRRVAEDAESVLPAVRAPTLYIQSREDNRISATDALAMYERLGAPSKAMRWLTGCGHIISADFCREDVAAQTLVWLETHRS